MKTGTKTCLGFYPVSIMAVPGSSLPSAVCRFCYERYLSYTKSYVVLGKIRHMKSNIIGAALVSLFFAGNVNAQQSKSTEAMGKAAYGSAKTNQSYIRFSDRHFHADKKYVVFKFWNTSSPLTEEEKMDITYLEKQLAKKNIQLVQVAWQSETDLQAALKSYHITVDAKANEYIHIKGADTDLKTTAMKSLLILEEKKPVLLCSGKDCESRAKEFFKLSAYN
jgi:hypothetical protein